MIHEAHLNVGDEVMKRAGGWGRRERTRWRKDATSGRETGEEGSENN